MSLLMVLFSSGLIRTTLNSTSTSQILLVRRFPSFPSSNFLTSLQYPLVGLAQLFLYVAVALAALLVLLTLVSVLRNRTADHKRPWIAVVGLL